MSGISREELASLLCSRWEDAKSAVGTLIDHVQVTWDIGDSELFKAERCNASTIGDGGPHCHIRFAERILARPLHNIDGVIRHEIGHVIDLTTFQIVLEEWAQERGVHLPYTPERRADAIAHAVWGTPILYDQKTVQSTETGIPLRPEHLGL
jgi:hypothetical protein